MRTERIYEENGMIFRFEATVLRCSASGAGYASELDRTAFFPEGGGQAADTGMLGEARVTDVQIRNGQILHYTDRPLEEGVSVVGEVDREVRFRRMQNHSGEHVLSGTLHRMFGANNVGFHLGLRDVTVDIDIELTREELMQAEEAANRAVAQDLAISVFKPDEGEAERIPYRSKKEIGEDLRLVRIEGVDCCACCAPHVPSTGYIGIIKILDAIRYKGGMRLHLLCGLDAEKRWEEMFADHACAAAALSVKQTDVAEAVGRLQEENMQLRHALKEEKRRTAMLLAERACTDAGYACVVLQDADMPTLRDIALGLLQRADGVFAACCPGEGGLTFAAAGREGLGQIAQILRREYGARCGGSGTLIQGTAPVSAAELERILAGSRSDLRSGV